MPRLRSIVLSWALRPLFFGGEEVMSVPELRFPGFEGEWEDKNLGDIAKFSKGKNISKKDISEEGIPCIRYGELYTRYKEKITDVFSKTDLGKDELVFSSKNDIIIPTSGETAIDLATASCVLNEGVAIGGDTNIIKTKGDGLFFSYYLNSKRKNIAKLAQGVSVVHLYSTHLKIIDLKVPRIEEQEKIASFLSAVDEKIEKLEKKLELWEAYKKGMMQKIFSQELRFKDENGDEYPEWEERKLCEISIINPKANILPDEFVYIDLESVDSGILKKIKKTMKKDAPSRAKRVLENNDILYQTVRPYQKNNLFFQSNNLDNYVASTGYAQIRAEQDSKFLYHLIHTKNFVNNVLARCTGTSYPAINSKDLGKIKIFIPSSSEQKKIASFLSRLDEKIEMLGIKLEFWENYKKGLLQKMFC